MTNPLYDWQPLDEDVLEALRREAPPLPPHIRAGVGWEPTPDTTTGRIAQLGRLRGLLWHVLRTKAQ
jgi:hypothetical protein